MARQPQKNTSVQLTASQLLAIRAPSPVAVAAKNRPGGAHGPSGRAAARQQRRAVRRELRAGDFDQ